MNTKNIFLSAFLILTNAYFNTYPAATKKVPPSIQIMPSYYDIDSPIVQRSIGATSSTIPTLVPKKMRVLDCSGAGSSDQAIPAEADTFHLEIPELNIALLAAFASDDHAKIRAIYCTFAKEKKTDFILADELLKAARSGDQEMVNSILAILKTFDITAIIADGAQETPFSYAIRAGHTEIASKILAHNRKYAIQENREGLMPFMLCAQTDNVEIARQIMTVMNKKQLRILVNYMPIHKSTYRGIKYADSALIIAVNHESVNMVDFLLENDASIHNSNFWGFAPYSIVLDPSYPHKAIRRMILNQAFIKPSTPSFISSLLAAPKTPTDLSDSDEA